MQNKTVSCWLFVVCGFIVVMIVFGGLVRLTFSGLSIVEWKVVTGVVPPLGEQAWMQEFQKYQQTPQYRLENLGMGLAEFKFIYLMEYVHRLIGRIAGLVYVIPLLLFWVRGTIPRQKIPLFIGIGLLFGLQGFMGWYMVQSGLVNEPNVSAYRLTLHLLLALLLLGITLWTALSWHPGSRSLPGKRLSSAAWTVVLLLFLVLLLQITLGGLVAGTRAGHISNTFPKMSGRWIPGGILLFEPAFSNFYKNPIWFHFAHRWHAFLVLALAVWSFFLLRRQGAGRTVVKLALWVKGVIFVQIGLGIAAILLSMPVALASLHQAVALVLFMLLITQMFFMRHTAENANSKLQIPNSK